MRAHGLLDAEAALMVPWAFVFSGDSSPATLKRDNVSLVQAAQLLKFSKTQAQRAEAGGSAGHCPPQWTSSTSRGLGVSAVIWKRGGVGGKAGTAEMSPAPPGRVRNVPVGSGRQSQGADVSELTACPPPFATVSRFLALRRAPGLCYLHVTLIGVTQAAH